MAKKKWIQGAIKRPGALRRKAGVKEGENIPQSKLASMAATAKRTGDTTTLRQVNLARTLKKMRRKK
jgi:hypothetical protein